jgi:hypothetical protein
LTQLFNAFMQGEKVVQDLVHREAAIEAVPDYTKTAEVGIAFGIPFGTPGKVSKQEYEIQQVVEYISTHENHSIGIIQDAFKFTHGTATRRYSEVKKRLKL